MRIYITLAILLLIITGCFTGTKKCNYRVYFSNGFLNDTCLIKYADKTIYNKVISTDETGGLADVFDMSANLLDSIKITLKPLTGSTTEETILIDSFWNHILLNKAGDSIKVKRYYEQITFR